MFSFSILANRYWYCFPQANISVARKWELLTVVAAFKVILNRLWQTSESVCVSQFLDHSPMLSQNCCTNFSNVHLVLSNLLFDETRWERVSITFSIWLAKIEKPFECYCIICANSKLLSQIGNFKFF